MTSRRVPGWVWAVGIYLLTRVWVAALTLVVAREQVANLWTSASPDYGAFVTMWDGQRYQAIAEQGYPLPLPVDDQGRPHQSAWAFYPAFPMLVRAVMAITGLSFGVAAPLVTLLAGAGASALCYQLFVTRADRRTALMGVALLGLFPTAPVLQFGYSEAVSLLGLSGALLLLHRGRYLGAVPFTVLFCLSRPVGAAILPVIAAVFCVRWWRAWRRGADFSGRERVELVALGGCAVVAVAAFPLFVAWAAGRWDGYTAVQLAWRVSDHMEYFTPWLWIARYTLGEFGPAVLGLSVVLLLVVLVSPPVRALGLVMWTWCASYLLYLAAVVDPFTSVPRFALLLFPFALALPLAVRPGRARLIVMLLVGVGFLAGQVWWVGSLWQFTPPSDFPP